MRPYSPGGWLSAFACLLTPSGANGQPSSFTAWTTRVSNPVRSPRFRASASVRHSPGAFAIGVLSDIYAFHRYTTHSPGGTSTPDTQYPRQPRGWAPVFHLGLTCPPTHPLNPMNPDNARILRITAAAGTELADAYSNDTLIGPLVILIALTQKRFTTHRAVLPHAAWLVQASAH